MGNHHLIYCIINKIMTITVKYFASLRELVGRAEERLELGDSNPTVAELWGQVAGGENQLPAQVLAAVNREYVKADATVRDGDEVAFFPPVTGG